MPGIYNSFNLTDDEEKDMDGIIKKFDEVFTKSEDPNYFRETFFEIVQHPTIFWWI